MTTLLPTKFGIYGGQFVPETLMPALIELEAAFVGLSDEALLHRPRFADIRRVNPPVFHYGVFFFIEGGVVVVLGVLHAARDSEAELRRRRELYA